MENNFIYDKLVRDENDFHGLVAYGLYKRHKIDFIKKIKDETGKDYVPEEDLKSFHLSSNTPSQLEAYMLQAERLLSDTFISMMQDQVEKEVDAIHRDIKNDIKSVLPGWGKTLIISVVSSIIASAITALILMFVSFKTHFDDKVEKIDRTEQHIESVEQHIEQLASSLGKTGND